jgi:hypothetical protein
MKTIKGLVVMDKILEKSKFNLLFDQEISFTVV